MSLSLPAQSFFSSPASVSLVSPLLSYPPSFHTHLDSHTHTRAPTHTHTYTHKHARTHKDTLPCATILCTYHQSQPRALPPSPVNHDCPTIIVYAHSFCCLLGVLLSLLTLPSLPLALRKSARTRRPKLPTPSCRPCRAHCSDSQTVPTH